MKLPLKHAMIPALIPELDLFDVYLSPLSTPFN